MRREAFAVLLVLLAVLTLAVIVVSPSSARPPSCEVNPNPARCRTPTPTPTTPTPTPTTPTPTPTTPTPTPTTTAPGSYSCNEGYGGVCGPYSYPAIPMSNGFDTYVTDQLVGPQSGTSESVHANSPGDWQIIANDVPYGYTGVQTFPDAQQLMNDWNGSGWGGNGSQDTPLAALSALSVTYSETSPSSQASIYEFAADVWQNNYNSDVMFWVDTKGRCDEGAFGGTVLGHVVIDGQGWTVHRYGGPGAEVIFVLDGAGGPGTCAQQPSGTINVKAGLEWLLANGFENGPIVLSQLNTGWEICSADNQPFTVHQYSITGTVA
jgi:hypothetical protein